MAEDELEEVLSTEVVDKVVMSEGMKAITDLFEFFHQALDVAVDWISQVDDRGYDHEMIRTIISQNVEGVSLDTIINKMTVLSELQQDI